MKKEITLNKENLFSLLVKCSAFNEICLLWESIDSYYYNINDLPETDCRRLVVGVNRILLKIFDKFSNEGGE